MGFADLNREQLREQLAKYETIENIVYKTVDGRRLDMLIFLPDKNLPRPMPVMLHTHGGGWSGGNKYKVLRRSFAGTLDQLLESGVAVATIEYRLARGDSTAVECVVDCMDAGRFLVKHASQYGLDPDRIGVWGGSAGGHLSLMTGLTPGELFPGASELAGYDPTYRCVASYFPATSFERIDLLKGSHFEDPQKFVPMLGGPYEDNLEKAKLLSPVKHLSKTSPPVLLLHGEKDDVLPISGSRYMVDVANEVGANVKLLSVKNGRHSFGGNNLDPSLPEIQQHATEFILQHLKPGQPAKDRAVKDEKP